jgi:hypothetical protein
MTTATVEIPKDQVILQGAKVIRVQKYAYWSGEIFCTTCIERESDDMFRSSIGNPGSGVMRRGNLEVALSPLSREFREAYTRLFGLVDPSDDELWEVAQVAGYRKETCEVERR